MERLPRQKYSKEFREQAVRVVREQELTIPEAARWPAKSEKTLANWVFRARQEQLAGLGETRRPVTDLEAEVARLKRELAEARMERDCCQRSSNNPDGDTIEVLHNNRAERIRLNGILTPWHQRQSHARSGGLVLVVPMVCAGR